MVKKFNPEKKSNCIEKWKISKKENSYTVHWLHSYLWLSQKSQNTACRQWIWQENNHTKSSNMARLQGHAFSSWFLSFVASHILTMSRQSTSMNAHVYKNILENKLFYIDNIYWIKLFPLNHVLFWVQQTLSRKRLYMVTHISR